MNFKKRFSEIFSYHNTKTYSYTLSETQVSNNINPDLEINTNKHISTSLKETKNFITVKYNVLINSDIVLRPLNINIKGNNYSALIFYIDGMTDSDNINNYVLKPLMMKNQNNMFKENNGCVIYQQLINFALVDVKCGNSYGQVILDGDNTRFIKDNLNISEEKKAEIVEYINYLRLAK